MSFIEAVKSFVEFISDEKNYNLIKENWVVFLLFAIIIFIMTISGCLIFCKVKYRKLEEYKKLKKENKRLKKSLDSEKKKNAALNEQIRELTKDKRMLKTIRSNNIPKNIGELISKKL